MEERGESYASYLTALDRLRDELERIKDVEEVNGLKRRVTDLRTSSNFLMEAADPNTVFWIERRAAGGVKNFSRTQSGTPAAFHTYLQATPIDVSEILSTTLFSGFGSVDPDQSPRSPCRAASTTLRSGWAWSGRAN